VGIGEQIHDVIEHVLGMAILAGTREYGRRPGTAESSWWYRSYGYFVWVLKPPHWVDGLWTEDLLS